MDVVLWIVGILAFVLVLMVSVGLHEAAHMWVAKAFKLHVPKFFVGFGKTLWSFKTKKTEYGIKNLPLGGFVLIEDGATKKPSEHTSMEREVKELEDAFEAKYGFTFENLNKHEGVDPDEIKVLTDKNKILASMETDYTTSRSLLSNVSPWKRTLVFLAGPAMNIVLGTVILMVTLMTFPTYKASNIVDQVSACNAEVKSCGGSQAGLQPGDKIVAIDGKQVADLSQIRTLANVDAKSLALTYERNGVQNTVVAPVDNGKLNIVMKSVEHYATFGESALVMKTVFYSNLESLANLPSKMPAVVQNLFGAPKDPESPSSVVNVGKTYGEVSASKAPEKDKIYQMLVYSGLLNLGLGFINLLPFLPLDGGRIFVAFMDSCRKVWSKVSRKAYTPTSLSTVKTLTMTTAIPVFAFMALLIVTDLANIIRGIF